MQPLYDSERLEWKQLQVIDFFCAQTHMKQNYCHVFIGSSWQKEKIRIYSLKQAVRQLPTKPVDNSVYWLLYPVLNCGFYYGFVKLYKNTTTW